MWPADLVKQCSVIFTMLVDDTAVRSVIDDIFVAQPPKGTIIVECSTIYPGSQIPSVIQSCEYWLHDRRQPGVQCIYQLIDSSSLLHACAPLCIIADQSLSLAKDVLSPDSLPDLAVTCAACSEIASERPYRLPHAL